MVGKKVTVRYCASNLKRFTNSESQPLAYGRYTTNIEGMRETLLPGDDSARKQRNDSKPLSPRDISS